MALIVIQYYDLNHVNRQIRYDTLTGAATYFGSSGINLTAPTTDPGTILTDHHSGFPPFYQLCALPVYPYFISRDPNNIPAPFSVTNGINYITVNNVLPQPRFRFVKYDGTFDSGWVVGPNPYGAVAGGKYLSMVMDYLNQTHIAFGLGVSYDQLAANVVQNDISFPAGNDGQIQINVTKGSGDYTLTFEDATTQHLNNGNEAQSYTRANLVAGDYSVTIHDNLSGAADIVIDTTLTEPIINLPSETFFNVPKNQSLEFCHEIIPDGITKFQTLDNVRYINQQFPYFEMEPYQIKLCKTDPAITVQWQSNYENHVVELRKFCDDSLVQSYVSSKKVNNLTNFQNFAITIRDNGDGRSRVYFTTSIFPILIALGDVIGINANADGFDGNYTVQAIGLDTTLNAQYFVINKAYAIMADHSDGNGVFFNVSVDFNIFETVIDFSTQNNDTYYVKIYPVVTTGDPDIVIPALTEPIFLADEQIGTNVIKFKNLDNAWDIDYSTGIVHFLRIESSFFKRKPKSIIDTARNTSGQLFKIRALKQRGMTLELIMLPPYLHEKLSIVFDCDYIEINGVQFATDQQYGDPNYLFNYGLSSAEIDIEQAKWMNTYNSDDLGGQLMPGSNRIFDETFDSTFN
jgi:hypothetical protein